MTLCIIGAGITGLSLLLLLQENGTDLSKVTIIDPYFDGGDLARKWGPVNSNTPWSKTANALRTACPSLRIDDPIDPTKTTPLIDLAHLLRTAAAPALKAVNQIQGKVISISQHGIGPWNITYSAAGKENTLSFKVLILAQGAEPRSLDIPLPSIPLECALDPSRLKGYVRAGQRVLLFGTMHSGTLIMRNLNGLGASVTACYASPIPFTWDRDGAYDGLKEEAAEIADTIIAGHYPQTRLVPTTQTSDIIRSALTADWVIYAIGFSPRCEIQLLIDGKPHSLCEYDKNTGIIAPRAWGFGVAYPNQAPDGIHWDVSVAAFLDHMKQQLPQILAALQ